MLKQSSGRFRFAAARLRETTPAELRAALKNLRFYLSLPSEPETEPDGWVRAGSAAILVMFGEMSEWPKEHDWKSCVSKGTEGSNPSLSALGRGAWLRHQAPLR